MPCELNIVTPILPNVPWDVGVFNPVQVMVKAYEADIGVGTTHLYVTSVRVGVYCEQVYGTTYILIDINKSYRIIYYWTTRWWYNNVSLVDIVWPILRKINNCPSTIINLLWWGNWKDYCSSWCIHQIVSNLARCSTNKLKISLYCWGRRAYLYLVHQKISTRERIKTLNLWKLHNCICQDRVGYTRDLNNYD